MSDSKLNKKITKAQRIRIRKAVQDMVNIQAKIIYEMTDKPLKTIEKLVLFKSWEKLLISYITGDLNE